MTDPARVSPAATIVFVRHGETDWNVERRFQGQRDIPLNDRGREQARRNGRALRDIAGADGFRFLASPLMRAAESMRLIRHEMGLDPEAFDTDPALIEITFGQWEGSTLAELGEAEPDRVARRQADKWSFVPPGGESYAMLTERIAHWLRSVDEDTVAVSHGAVARVVQGLLTGAPTADIPALPAHQDQVMVWRAGAVEWI